MKSSKIIFYFIIAIVIFLVVWIGKESFTQPGLERFDGKFEMLSSYRNENNTGPVVRVMAVRSLDSETGWMKEFGDFQPHTKYGKTIVFFFSEEVNNEVELAPKAPYFPSELEGKVIATYEKGPMGDVKFKDGYQE